MAASFQGLSEPAAQLRGQELYTRLDQLADADPGDPDVRAQVVHLAADLAAHLPAELADAITSALARQVDRGPAERWLDAVTDLLAPAQAEVLRQLFTRLAERRSCA